MFVKKKKVVREYMYDFAEQGGAVGAIALGKLDPNGVLPEGFVVEKVTVVCETALASAGAATVTVGPSVDSDGYLADIFALMNASGAIVRSGEVAGALVWDDTNDHEISYRVGSAANTQDVVMQIGTAALTAGKLRVIVEGMFPSGSELA